MRIRRIASSAAFAAGPATLPLSAAKAQYYPLYSPPPLSWPICAAGAAVVTVPTPHRAAPSAHGGAALLLQLLRAAARLPAAGLLRAGIYAPPNYSGPR